MSVYGEHFAKVARSYDSMRGTSRREVQQLQVRLAGLEGRTLLDVGCGTGADAELLVRNHRATVTGVDASPEMAAQARARLEPLGMAVHVARAEELPFADLAFERVTMNTAVHLFRRPEAFAEARRVLAGDGALAICTVDPACVDDFWLAGLFPSYAEIDRGRFPSTSTLTSELRAAGFTSVEAQTHRPPYTYTRERALELLEGKFASSLSLIGEDEYREGIERAARELPDEFEPGLVVALLAATR
jgi:cyclopropane fatty-acyl-phospholipid synthase-like methyltransferase